MLDLREVADEWRDDEDDIAVLEGDAAEAIHAVAAPAGHPAPRLYRALHGSIIEAEWSERIDEEREDRIKPYVELCEELDIDATPDDLAGFADGCEPTMIPDDEFEGYAEELAEETGAIDSTQWPACHIDWEKAADSLRIDYTSLTFKGTDYLVRSW